jgi:hypothetical protein
VTMRRCIAVLALASSATACMSPSTRDAQAVLSRTAANLGRITSGDLFVRFEMSTKDAKPGGFELKGPFSFESDGRYPLADFEHVAFDGDEEERKARFVSTGSEAFIVTEGRRRQLSNTDLDASGLADLVRTDTQTTGGDAGGEDAEGESASAAAELNIDSWIDGTPEISGGGLVGRVDTDKVTADLDVGEVMDGIVRLGQMFGGGAAGELQPLSEEEKARVVRATESATLEAWSGKDDRLLRRLVMEIVFATPDDDLAERVKALSGATIKLEAVVTELNKDVQIEAPPSD